jgi:NAD(P)-dependent dehydrogenase (short-subunit alcohol dehydrogenase family)
MKGKTVVVTRGTSGIGEVAAEKLAEMGARIVLVARDRSRGEGTLARLREKAPGLAYQDEASAGVRRRGRCRSSKAS